MSYKLLGIYRETSHSPQREFDDYEILRLTGKHLSDSGFEVILKKPEEVLKEKKEWNKSLPDLSFIMCEEDEIIDLLKQWENQGATVVNSIQSIWNTYRDKMTSLLQSAKVSIPKSDLVSTSPGGYQMNGSFKAVWIKRGDFHNCQAGDVLLAQNENELKGALSGLHQRGIHHALVQDHVDGDLVKFYGIGSKKAGSFWFKWFYHKDQNLKKYAFSEPHLKETVCSAAESMGLEVFGGDAVIDCDGNAFLIDINAWPSFALFRDEASKMIGNHLMSHLKIKVAP
jgi:hypothetical protein